MMIGPCYNLLLLLQQVIRFSSQALVLFTTTLSLFFSIAVKGENNTSETTSTPLNSESSPEANNIAPATASLTSDSARRTTNFEWTPVNQAKSYEIEITPTDRHDDINTPYTFSVTTAEKRATLRQSIVRTNNWYFLASYFITQIQYSSENGDRESKSSFSALGGTGRLGLGFLSSATPYGFLGIIDYSGFTISNKTYRYPSVEIHSTYRLTSESLGEVRISGGAYMKQLPEILGDAPNVFEVKSIDMLGLHLGGEYWYPLTSTLGLQINGRVYSPIQGNTPTHSKIVSSPSLQFGFLGSLRLNANATGLMGYAFRKDQFSYKVTNSASLADGYTNNTSSILGHYLNFLLEWDIRCT